mgnify:CR=1 FL=1
MVRSSTLATRNQDYVQAAVALGCSTTRIMWRHVLPNIASPIIVLVTTLMTFSLLARTNEITACKALGMSLYRLSLPALATALGEAQRLRSARKLEPVRIQLDPYDL